MRLDHAHYCYMGRGYVFFVLYFFIMFLKYKRMLLGNKNEPIKNGLFHLVLNSTDANHIHLFRPCLHPCPCVDKQGMLENEVLGAL